MILPDLNLLLYAYNPQVPQHDRAKLWWEGAMKSDELIGLPNEVTLGFVQIATNPRLGAATVSIEAAREVVETWHRLSQVRVLSPEPDHFTRVMDLMEQAMGAGTLVSDAALAAHAIANRATLCSNDSDFARFPGLDWVNPLVE